MERREIDDRPTQEMAPVIELGHTALAGELPRVQRINGIPLNLGSMSYGELMSVYEATGERVHAAESDFATVGYYMDQRFPFGPRDAA